MTEVYKKQKNKCNEMKHNSDEPENNEKWNKKQSKEKLSMTSNREQSDDEKTDRDSRDNREDDVNKNKKIISVPVFAEKVIKQLRINVRTIKKQKIQKLSVMLMHDQNNNNERFIISNSSIKKKKKSSAKKRQLIKLKLNRNVLKNKWLLNKRLLKIAKKSNIYEHHSKVFYVFSYQNLLYHKYKYLLNIQDSNKTFIITKNNKWKFMNSVSVKELYWLYSNVFNAKEASHKCALKANKDVHNNITDIYISFVIKSEKHQIKDINCHLLIKIVFFNHIEHNTGKSDRKKKCISKQQSELKKMVL